MTLTSQSPPPAPVTAVATAPHQALLDVPLTAPAQSPRRVAGTRSLVPAAATVAAALLLGFFLDLSLVGSLRHSRAQHVAFADLRKELASGVTPVGQVDTDGGLVAPGCCSTLLRSGSTRSSWRAPAPRCCVPGQGTSARPCCPGRQARA